MIVANSPTVGIDLSWDTIENTSQRFQAYLDSLDQLFSKSITELHELFFQLRKDMNQTFVIVTHNEILANMSDRKLVMKDGNIL